MADDLISQIPALLDKGGLPGAVGLGLIGLFWKFRKTESPDTQLAAAMSKMADEIRQMRFEMTDRFARVETKVENLEHRK